MCVRRAQLLAAAVCLAACATPAAILDRRALAAGYGSHLVRGVEFHHRIYRKAGQGEAIHVYLHGDGLPWATATRVSRDPHPRRPLAFELMLLDPAPALYLGRPCYGRVPTSDPCHAGLWTDERYSERVVSSLEAALRRQLQQPSPPLVLIGYSGGGVLAMLLCERFAATAAVVTVAANLDVGAWTAHHGFAPLIGSLDPALRPPLPASIAQWHLVGGRDANVPPEIAGRVARRQPRAEVVTYPNLDHACCWKEVWRDFLHRLRRSSPGGEATTRPRSAEGGDLRLRR